LQLRPQLNSAADDGAGEEFDLGVGAEHRLAGRIGGNQNKVSDLFHSPDRGLVEVTGFEPAASCSQTVFWRKIRRIQPFLTRSDGFVVLLCGFVGLSEGRNLPKVCGRVVINECPVAGKVRRGITFSVLNSCMAA